LLSVPLEAVNISSGGSSVATKSVATKS
jgi:hypothetical protein